MADEETRRTPSEDDLRELGDICALLLDATGHDFSAYKDTTLARRVDKRLQARHVDSFADYRRLLNEDRGEAKALLRDLLISVTQFFRDADAFKTLTQTIIPAIFAQVAPEESVRVWVPACATGEEAYSFAIVLKEHVTANHLTTPIQVFATDIDRGAIDIARQGRYPARVVDDIPADYLARYFRRFDDAVSVTQEIREVCVFSEHSLIKDPPFSRIDLISCRNVFIYWKAELQQNVLPLFHYALRPDGYLFLGSAENITAMTDLFRVVDKKHRIFQRLTTPIGKLVPHALSTLRTGRAIQPPEEAGRIHALRERDLVRLIASSLLEHHAPPAIIISELGEIFFFSGRTGRFIEAPTGAPSNNLFDIVKRSLRPEIHALLHRAMKSQAGPPGHPAQASSTGVPLESDGAGLVQKVDLVVRRMPELGAGLNLYAVVFHANEPPQPIDTATAVEQQTAAATPPELGWAAHQLEAELRETREHLQTTIEQVKSSNEELLSMNEELQSANEEMQTSKEELQSANEELETLNTELSSKVDALDHANNDLQNFFANTQVPTLFLDREFRIQNFTPSASRLFRLIPTDIGRAITDITTRLESHGLSEEVERVSRTLLPSEKAVRTQDQHEHFIMRVNPYRTQTNVISGVVVTYAEVTELKNLQTVQGQLAAIVESSGDAIVGLDTFGIITTWNLGAERLFWYSAKEAIGQPMDALLVPPARRNERAGLLEQAKSGRLTASIETERLRKDGKPIWVFLTASPIADETTGESRGVSIIMRDITDKRRAEEAQARIAAIVASSDDAIISMDLDGVLTSWNDAAERLFGYAHSEIIGKPIFRLIPADHPEDVVNILHSIRQGTTVSHFETIRLHKDGHRIDVSLSVSPIRDVEGRIVGASKIARNVTERKRAERAVTAALRLRDEFISIASHELKTPLTSMKLQTQMLQRSIVRGDPSAFGPERVATLVDRMSRQVDRLTYLVDDMLDVSRIGSGKLSLERERVDLATVVREVLEELGGQIATAQCTVQTDLADGIEGNWDRSRIEQVLTNLMTNALRYAKGKPITIASTRMVLDKEPAGSETEETQRVAAAVLEVRDEGMGIATKDQARIFERFERAAVTQDTSFGIGLYITREIVRSHGGTISVTSELEKGATFRIVLPLEPPAEGEKTGSLAQP